LGPSSGRRENALSCKEYPFYQPIDMHFGVVNYKGEVTRLTPTFLILLHSSSYVVNGIVLKEMNHWPLGFD
jgi:hypothetical protein